MADGIRTGRITWVLWAVNRPDTTPRLSAMPRAGLRRDPPPAPVRDAQGIQKFSMPAPRNLVNWPQNLVNHSPEKFTKTA